MPTYVGRLRKNRFAVTQRHLRLNALHTIKLQIHQAKPGEPKNRPLRARLKKGWLLWQKNFGVSTAKIQFFYFFSKRRENRGFPMVFTSNGLRNRTSYAIMHGLVECINVYFAYTPRFAYIANTPPALGHYHKNCQYIDL